MSTKTCCRPRSSFGGQESNKSLPLHANSWLALLCCVAGSVGGPATPMAKPSKSGRNRNSSGSIKLSSWSELLVVLPPPPALQCRYSQCVLARVYSPQSDTSPTELVCACVCESADIHHRSTCMDLDHWVSGGESVCAA